MIHPIEYVSDLTAKYLRAGDPVRAEGQRAYMRNQFDFCGLKAPEWMAIAKATFRQQGMYTGKKLDQFVRLCFDAEYRELHYTALEMMQRQLKHQEADWILVLERCVVVHAWWDTVDWIAKLIGMHFQRFPELQHAYCNRWIRSEYFWLQRVAIIHQLHYKDKTDEALLFDLIRHRASSKEFFIRKACGWALRQYSKTAPDRVRWFVEKERKKLSNLTIKEALRLMPEE